MLRITLWSFNRYIFPFLGAEKKQKTYTTHKIAKDKIVKILLNNFDVFETKCVSYRSYTNRIGVSLVTNQVHRSKNSIKFINFDTPRKNITVTSQNDL